MQLSAAAHQQGETFQPPNSTTIIEETTTPGTNILGVVVS